MTIHRGIKTAKSHNSHKKSAAKIKNEKGNPFQNPPFPVVEKLPSFKFLLFS